MPHRGIPRVLLIAVVGVLLVACALVQAGSDALAHDTSRGLVPRAIPAAFGERVYRAIDRFSQPTFVEQTLALRALDCGDAALAEHYALRMAASPWRDEVLARIAQARGDEALAYEYFLAAGDVDALQRRIAALAEHRPEIALERERVLEAYLEVQRVHPDAVADAIWRQGLLYAKLGNGDAASAAYLRALNASPLNMTYLLSAANQALVDGKLAQARGLYQRALATIDPRSSDAYAGLGLVALREGHRAEAERDAQLARASDPNSADLLWLERELR